MLARLTQDWPGLGRPSVRRSGENFQTRGPGMGRALLRLLLWFFLPAFWSGGEGAGPRARRWGPGARASEFAGGGAPTGARLAAGQVCKHLRTPQACQQVERRGPHQSTDRAPSMGRGCASRWSRVGVGTEGSPLPQRRKSSSARPAAGSEVFAPEECRSQVWSGMR